MDAANGLAFYEKEVLITFEAMRGSESEWLENQALRLFDAGGASRASASTRRKRGCR